MIAIQIILVVGFILLFWRFLSNPGSHQVQAWIKILTFLFTLVVVTVVIFPDISDKAAHAVGVKTGANLLLYLLTLAFIFAVVTLYTKSKEEERRTVILTRKIALLEAELKKKKDK